MNGSGKLILHFQDTHFVRFLVLGIRQQTLQLGDDAVGLDRTALRQRRLEGSLG